MSGLNVTGGPLGTYYYFAEKLCQKAGKGCFNFMTILPVNRAVRQFTRTLIDNAANKTVISPAVYTFDDLLIKLYKNRTQAKKVLDRDLLSLLISEIVRSDLAAFTFFKIPGKVPGAFYKRIADIIFELRRFGYTSGDIAKLRVNQGSEKLSDILRIQEMLEDYLDPDLIDESAAVNIAASAVTREEFDRLFPGIDEIYISGYGLFTPAMFEFIENVSRWKDVHIKIEHVGGNPDLFKHTEAAAERLGTCEEIQTTPIADVLFNRSRKPVAPATAAAEIHITATDDRNREIEFIAEQIRRLHGDTGLPLNRIGVTFADLESYAPLIRQIFREYEIPFNISTGFRLIQSPLIRTFLDVLTIRESGLETADLLELLRASLLEIFSEKETLALQAFFFGKRIRHLSRRRLEILIEEQSGRSAQARDTQALLKKLMDFLKPFYDIPDKQPPSQFRTVGLNLFRHCNLLGWYKRPSPELSERGQENEFRAFNRFMKLYDRVIWMLNRLYGSSPISFADFLEHLTSAIRETSYNLTEWPGYGVQIMPRLELQAMECNVLFIGGLIDGEFPRTSARDIFFSDETRSRMGLITTNALLDQDRFIFYTLLDSGADALYLTYPRYRGDRALVPSNFLSELSDVLPLIHLKDDQPAIRNKTQLKTALGAILQTSDKSKISHSKELCNSFIRLFEKKHQDAQKILLSVLERISATSHRRTGMQFGHFEGALPEHGPIHEDLTRRYRDNVWSITQIEDYARCPMNFFMNRILGLEDVPAFEETLSYLEKGNLIHRIFFQFYTHLKSIGETGEPLKHKSDLYRIARENLAALPFEGFFWELEKQLYFGRDDEPGLLDVFLMKDQEFIRNAGTIPFFFEFSFGNRISGETDPASGMSPVTLTAGNEKLTCAGKIDRIDLLDQKFLCIHDYKTGKISVSGKLSEIQEGKSFQLPLYLLAISKLLPGYTPVYAGYFRVTDVQNCRLYPVLADGETVQFLSDKDKALIPNKQFIDEDGTPLGLEDLLRESLSKALGQIRQLKAGYFSHYTNPEDEFCSSYCTFRRMCQKNVSKINRVIRQGLNE